jgi:hypothetical protein
VLLNQIDAGIAPIWNGMFGLPPAARPYITAVTTLFNAALPGLIANLDSMLVSMRRSRPISAMLGTISSGIPSTHDRRPPSDCERRRRRYS